LVTKSKRHMNKLIIVSIFFLALTEKALSQAAMPENMRAASTLDRLGGFHGNNVPDMLYGIPFPPGKVIGDTYLSTDWKYATVLLYENDKMIEGVPTRYDVATNELEFNAKNGIKVLPGNKIRNFVWVDTQINEPGFFINAREFKNIDNVPLDGFYQVLSDGAMPLLKRTKITVKKADYNAALSVGSRDDKILKIYELFYAKDNIVYKIPSNAKKLVSVFGDKSSEMKKYIDDNSLAAGKEQDLIKIFEYYNSLMKN
jgi:hypothetical protein